ncbi:MAG TPA: hypothetical protein DCZ91_22810 [Lachnospiraceae bacterium]|nr:hypothetical protein [Lachnospiraceae bacterium]
MFPSLKCRDGFFFPSDISRFGLFGGGYVRPFLIYYSQDAENVTISDGFRCFFHHEYYFICNS